MPNAQFNKELTTWINTLPGWKKNLGLDILTHGNCREEAITKGLDDFLIAHELKEAPEKLRVSAAEPRPPIDDSDKVTQPIAAKLRLKSIHGFKAVSALRDNERIEAGPGLTVIYGANGAGKSSYVRLLNKAFSSRGDDTILHNVFEEATGEPSCEFCFEVDGVEKTLSFPADDGHDYLQRYSVFDGESARVHLDQKNELMFVPGGFEFFIAMNAGLDAIRNRLEQLIRDRKPQNTVASAFAHNGVMRSVIQGLHAGSPEAGLRKHALQGEEAKERLSREEQELVNLKTREVSGRIKELKSFIAHLSVLLDQISGISKELSKEKITALVRARTQVQWKEREAKETGVTRFAELGLKYAETPQFKDFLISAASFMAVRSNDDGCPYCDQPLGKKERQLQSAYNAFLTSSAETELTEARKIYHQRLKSLEDHGIPKFDETQTVYTLLQKKPEGKRIADIYTELIRKADAYRNNLFEALDTGTEFPNIKESILPSGQLFAYYTNLLDRLKKIEKEDPTVAIREKEAAVSLLRDQIKLGEELENVVAYLNELKWCATANNLRTRLATNAVTIKQGEFFNKYVTEDYINVFADECKRLNAELKVEILQQGAKGKTIRDLKIKGVDPRRVLSEGEQRATALADFLTEIRVAGNCSGLVFDDPVTSLDHDRKRLIAKRIAEESKERQVIVFTHDLVFVHHLTETVEDPNQWCCHHVEKDGKGPGRIWLNNTPVTSAMYRKSGIPQGFYNKAKNAPPSERHYLLEQGFSSLRTCYEAVVEHYLLGGAVRRWDEAIRITNLKNVNLNKEVFDIVVEKHHSLSRYIGAHSHSDAYSALEMTPEILIEEINYFNKLKKEYAIK